MSSTQHQIVIIGAGSAGITVAAHLLNANPKLDIALIDPSKTHYYQPAWTLVGAGTFDFEKTARPQADYIPKGATWIQEYVDEIMPTQNKVVLRNGNEVKYEYLVACPGIQLDLDGIEGLKDSIDKNGVCSNYTNPNYTWEVIRNFKGGNAVFTQPSTPIKCGGAPQKIMYLADDHFAKAGVKKDTNVIFATPGSVIFGVKVFADTLMKVVNRKGITLKYYHNPIKIDGGNKKIHFKLTATQSANCVITHNPNQAIKEEIVGESTIILSYDMLHLAPPQSAPDFIKRSPLAHKEGPSKGWINVDINTLQHKLYPNVFALGDAAALPTAKTGAAIRKQAPVVAGNLLSAIAKQQLGGSYSGYSSCPLVTGYGKMVLAEFKYDNVRDSDPVISKLVDTTKEQYSMWLLKKYGLPYMYWNLMLRGKA